MTETKTGSKMPDGTIYLGFHKDRHWYVTDEDAKDLEGGSLKMTFNHAAMYARDLKAHGHHDWQVPDWDILREMVNHKDAGAFKDTYDRHSADWYWSSTPHSSAFGHAAGRSLNGYNGWYPTNLAWSVRCVRSSEKPFHDDTLTETRLKLLKSRAPGKVTLKKSRP